MTATMAQMLLECLACGQRTVISGRDLSGALWVRQHYLPTARYAVVDVDGERQQWIHSEQGWMRHD